MTEAQRRLIRSSSVSCRLAISRRYDYHRSRVPTIRDETVLIIVEVKHHSLVWTSSFDKIMRLITDSESSSVAMKEPTEAKQF